MIPHTLLLGGLLNLGGLADADQAVTGLKLLHGLGGVVDEGEAGGLAATVLAAETKDGDLLLLGLVHATELLTQLILGDTSAAGVEDVTTLVSNQVPSECLCRRKVSAREEFRYPRVRTR